MDDFAVANSGIIIFGLFFILWGVLMHLRLVIQKSKEDGLLKLISVFIFAGFGFLWWGIYGVLSAFK